MSLATRYYYYYYYCLLFVLLFCDPATSSTFGKRSSGGWFGGGGRVIGADTRRSKEHPFPIRGGDTTSSTPSVSQEEVFIESEVPSKEPSEDTQLPSDHASVPMAQRLVRPTGGNDIGEAANFLLVEGATSKEHTDTTNESSETLRTSTNSDKSFRETPLVTTEIMSAYRDDLTEHTAVDSALEESDGMDEPVSKGEDSVGTAKNKHNADTESSVSQTNAEMALNSTTTDPTLVYPPPLPSWKASLPPLLQRKGPKTLQRLLLGNVEIFLLGTAHVSNDSCHDVQELLESTHPECIFVELCEARVSLLDGSAAEEEQIMAAQHNTTKKLSWGERVQQIQQSQGGTKWQAICTLLLTSVQEDYADTLGVELGGEFRAAHQYWKKQKLLVPLPRRTLFPVLILGDRPLSLTLIRAWESLRWWPKFKVMVGLLWSSFRKPKPEEIREWLESVLREESDVLTESLADLRLHFPSLHTTIIEERDDWLACKLVQTCRILRGSPTASGARHRLVAIVGAGHVPGIVQRLTNSTSKHTTEEILWGLCQTRKWEKDELFQTEVIPQWVSEVTQVQDL